ncbi:MAG: hypothetical protein QOG30_477 [Acidimicrobiaceae bacterium]
MASATSRHREVGSPRVETPELQSQLVWRPPRAARTAIEFHGGYPSNISRITVSGTKVMLFDVTRTLIDVRPSDG